jgi:hypothetical protein
MGHLQSIRLSTSPAIVAPDRAAGNRLGVRSVVPEAGLVPVSHLADTLRRGIGQLPRLPVSTPPPVPSRMATAIDSPASGVL